EGHVEVDGELADRGVAASEALDDSPPGGISEGRERSVERRRRLNHLVQYCPADDLPSRSRSTNRDRAMSPRLGERRSGCSSGVGESLQPEIPAVGGSDCGAHLLPARAVAVEVAALELDAGPVGALGDETHLYLAGLVEIGLELPLPR